MTSAFIAVLGVSIMAWGEVPNFLAGMLPSLMTIGRFAADPADRAKLRRGEVVGTGLALGIGLGASLMAKGMGEKYWWLPFAGTVVVAGILLNEYEMAIREAQNNGATPMDQQGSSPQKQLVTLPHVVSVGELLFAG